MRILDLFSGIGGFSLAAHRCGWSTVQFCEIEPFCQAVLRKNFPGVAIESDIRKLDGKPFRGRIDLITGGFPCQDVSVAGRQKGIEGGDRSILWWQLRRIIRQARPRWCVIENVPNLRTVGGDTVLSGLERCGYTYWPFVVGAHHIGASHKRARVWIIAYLSSESDILADCRHLQGRGIGTSCQRCDAQAERAFDNCQTAGPDGELADTDNAGWREQRLSERLPQKHFATKCGGYPFRFPPNRTDYAAWDSVAELDPSLMPTIEREVRSMANGLSERLVRRRRNYIISSLGNSIVPQVAECIFRAIQRTEAHLSKE